jgi:signal recognition particle receptor subunit beta
MLYYIACDALEEILSGPELSSVPVLILANKSDYHGALTKAQITSIMQPILGEDRECHIQPASVHAGEGLFEALQWAIDKTSIRRAVY